MKSIQHGHWLSAVDLARGTLNYLFQMVACYGEQELLFSPITAVGVSLYAV